MTPVGGEPVGHFSTLSYWHRPECSSFGTCHCGVRICLWFKESGLAAGLVQRDSADQYRNIPAGRALQSHRAKSDLIVHREWGHAILRDNGGTDCGTIKAVLVTPACLRVGIIQTLQRMAGMGPALGYGEYKHNN